MRRAVREAAAVVAAMLGLGGEWADDRGHAPRRGALYVGLAVGWLIR